MRSIAGSLVALLMVSTALAEDWPRWRGPHLDGISREKDWLDQWPKDGPPIAWKANVGTGFSSVAVSGGRLCTLGHRDERDIIHCLDAVTGKPLWTHAYAAPIGKLLFEGGPTSTPTIHDGRVYTLSRWGDVFCLDAASGAVRWSRNVQKEEGMPLPGWGFAGSPLIHEKLLLLNVGRAGLALDRETGKTVWTSEKEEAGYSSPLPFRRGGDSFALVSSGNSYAAVRLATGKELWQVRWVTRYGVNAADPLLAGEEVFISSGYGKGAALLKMGDGVPTEVWRNRNMRNQLNSSVLLDGHVYGIDGDTSRASLRCIELKTGEVRWTQEEIGCGSLLAADGKLIVLGEKGELLIAKASPEKFVPSARAAVLEGKCWTVPVLANGRIYCRNAAGDLVCVDVRSKKDR